MSIKLRSACDKCHEAKVRCSGGAPCQGCLISKSLCLYSFSNPLGRPKGAKKKRTRGGPATNISNNNNWDGDDLSAEEAPTTTDGAHGDPGLRKRTRTRQDLNGHKEAYDDGNSGSASRNSIVSSVQREGCSDLLLSSGQGSGDSSSSYITSYHGNNDVASSQDVVVPNHIRLDSLSSIDNRPPGIGDTVPHHLEFSDLDSVIRAGFGFPGSSDARNPISWDNSAYNATNENTPNIMQTTAENLNLSDNLPMVLK